MSRVILRKTSYEYYFDFQAAFTKVGWQTHFLNRSLLDTPPKIRVQLLLRDDLILINLPISGYRWGTVFKLAGDFIITQSDNPKKSSYLQFQMSYSHQIWTAGVSFREEAISSSSLGAGTVNTIATWTRCFDKSLCFQSWIHYSHHI